MRMKLRIRATLSLVVAFAGALLLLAAGSEWFLGQYREDADRKELTRQWAAPLEVSLTPPVAGHTGLGILKIDRLHFEVIVRHGASDQALAEGLGWIPGTAQPGQHGNVGIAGHRDTFFRELQDVHVGDEVTLSTAAGDRHYQVQETRIVEPDELAVLAATREDYLTLVTCFPFRFVGPAPQRFIVRARAVLPQAMRELGLKARPANGLPEGFVRADGQLQ